MTQMVVVFGHCLKGSTVCRQHRVEDVTDWLASGTTSGLFGPSNSSPLRYYNLISPAVIPIKLLAVHLYLILKVSAA